MAVFFFNDTATTEIYTLSLHDALPISPWCAGTPTWTSPSARCTTPSTSAPTRRRRSSTEGRDDEHAGEWARLQRRAARRDRKSTRLNSSHANISYAVFCLKKINLLHEH